MMCNLASGSVIVAALLGAAAGADALTARAETLTLHAQSRTLDKSPGAEGRTVAVEKTLQWDPRKTALIVCDMWDDHWCQGAAQRVNELAGPVNTLVHRARDRGLLIIHAPSTCVDFYKETPQRARARSAPPAKPPVPLSQATRWGTNWCWPDPLREPKLPIDDSDMGCDCPRKCEIRTPWTRQTALIDIEEPDAISDDGQEVYNLLRQRGIDNLLIVGVHLNMCVLGRSFAIRQMVQLGMNVVLVRDLTDTMYCSGMKPFVNHFRGTDLVVEHVETYCCPTITSVDLVGGAPFQFQDDPRSDARSAKIKRTGG